jgi:phosphoribosylformylglycinamidine cyclo-ligase
MERTFNCGIGMIAVVSQDKAAEVASILINAGETVWLIGHLCAHHHDEPRVKISGVIGSLK